MKGEKDISKQFAAGRDAWDEKPAPELWDRLEARLDASADDPGPRPRRPFVVVGVVLMALVGAGLWWYLRSPAPAPEQPAPIAGSHSSGPSHAPFPPAEVPSPPTGPAEPERTLPADADPVSPAPGSSRLQARQVDPVEPKNVRIDWKSAPFANLADNKAAFDYDTAHIPRGRMVITDNFGMPVDTVQSVGQYRNNRHAGDYKVHGNTYLHLNGLRNYIEYIPNEDNPRHDPAIISHFNWLLGSWKSGGPGGETVENWRQVDEFTLEGRGAFVVNGDTIRAEKMRIEQKGEDVYYIVAVDSLLRPVKFRLRSRKPGELIFENAGDKGPDEIIYRAAPDGRNFSTIVNDRGDPTRSSTSSRERVLRQLSRQDRPPPADDEDTDRR